MRLDKPRIGSYRTGCDDTAMLNYYRVLGVPESARPDEIKRAYRRLVRRHHPDVHQTGEPATFRAIRQAYEILSDEGSRRAHDQHLGLDRTAPAPSAPGRRNWFADEIAIDFLSLDTVLDRIRESFFGAEDGRGVLHAEISLSRREAFEGVTVPLDVPLRRLCPACGGRGETWTDLCGRCGGTGDADFTHRMRVSIPPGVPEGARFRFSVAGPQSTPTRIEVLVTIE